MVKSIPIFKKPRKNRHFKKEPYEHTN